MRTLVIANPVSRSGATRRGLRKLEPLLRERLGEVEVAWTAGPRDARRLAREGVRAGASRVVVAGGDGTVSEVVTGIVGAGLERYVELALLPFGTGGDLARVLGVPRDLSRALDRIAEGKVTRVDVGRARYCGHDGVEVTSYFLNVASVGMGGLATAIVERSPKWLGGRIAFLLGTLRAIIAFRSQSVEIRLDGECLHDGPLSLAAAANGRFFGGGMRIAPRARPDDGVLDAVIVPGFPKLRLIRELPRLYRGTHLEVPGVLYRRGHRLEATSSGEVLIELDGEPLGRLPASFELISGALRVVGCEIVT